MAFTEKVQKISLRRLYYAVMSDEDTETYGEVKALTMPISLNLTPNQSEGNLDAGDRQVAYDHQLDSIGISGALADIPTEVQVDWFGHEKSSEGGLIMNVGDKPNYLAVGFESGTKMVWLYKAKFKPEEETNETKKKGDISYRQPGFSGEALPLKDGLIRYTVRTDDASVSITAEDFFTDVLKPTAVVPGP